MKIYEDERTLCFMDINPLNRGHCLIVTKRHAATIWESSVEGLAAAMEAAKRIALALREALQPDGLNSCRPMAPPPSSRSRTFTCI